MATEAYRGDAGASRSEQHPESRGIWADEEREENTDKEDKEIEKKEAIIIAYRPS